MIESRNAPGGRRFRTIQFRPKERSVVPWYADSAVDCLAVVTLWAGGRPMFDMRRRELVTLFGGAAIGVPDQLLGLADEVIE